MMKYTLKKYFLTKQTSHTFDKVMPEFQKKDWILTGGSYTDTSDSELFNNMFDTDVFHGSLGHEDNDEGGNRADLLDEELREILARYDGNWEHVFVQYNVEDGDGELYYDAWGGLSINLGEFVINDKYVNISHDDVSSLKNYDETSDIKWKTCIPHSFKSVSKYVFSRHVEFVKYLYQNLPSSLDTSFGDVQEDI